MFNERKVAQIAAYLLQKRGGKMSHLKLMKLMYLADRESYLQHGCSISEDCAVSMAKGPVLSQTLDLMDGDASVLTQKEWDSWISPKANHEVSLAHPINLHSLDELSASEICILDEIYKQYGHMGRWELAELTHDFPEWHDPEKSMLPISTHDIFKALGKEANEVMGLMSILEENRAIDALFASL